MAKTSIELSNLADRPTVEAEDADLKRPSSPPFNEFNDDLDLPPPSPTDLEPSANEQGFSASSLPLADEGLQAWLYLLAAFVLESLVWGFPYSYGVFQEYYLSPSGPYPNDQGLVTLTGTLSSGVTYMTGIVLYPLIERRPRLRRPFIFVGFLFLISGLIGSAFVRTPVGLVMTQGLLFSFGGSILFAPVVSYLHEWWILRRGLAYGVVGSATSISGVVFPFIINALLRRYGSRGTLWGLGVVLFFLVGALLPFVKPRLPNPPKGSDVGANDNEHSRHDYSFVKKKTFWLLWIASFVQALGFFLPILFISLYATKVDPSQTSLGSAALAALNGASMVSTIGFGALSDNPRFTLPLLLLSCFGSGLSVLLVWGFAAHSVSGLIGFAVSYGAMSGGFSALWAAMGREVGVVSPAQGATMYGIFAFGRGLGNVLAAPISTALLNRPPISPTYGMGKYGSLVLFTGAALTLAGVVGGSAWVGRGKSRRFKRA